MNIKKTLILAACIATSITAAALAYEQAIVVIYGRHLPKAWAIDLSNLTLGEIYQQIGPPQENLAAKGYQNWVVYHWWGRQVLRMGLEDYGPLTSRPTDIDYMAYVNNWYNQAYIKNIKCTSLLCRKYYKKASPSAK